MFSRKECGDELDLLHSGRQHRQPPGTVRESLRVVAERRCADTAVVSIIAKEKV